MKCLTKTALNNHRCKTPALNSMLVLGSLLLCFLGIEAGFRILDPFPYFCSSSINQSEHGNLLAYDETLGWKGAASGETELVTVNNKIWVSHNSCGFRDIEHKGFSEKPAIVFLGDSFTWGYEVEFEEMFVNRLRDLLPRYELFSLAHRGYGTDQALLTFKAWADKQPLKLVVLMFCENDVADNNSMVRYSKAKPKFQLIDNELVLAGVPVPKDEQWTQSPHASIKAQSWKEVAQKVLFRSHFLHYIQFNYWLLRNRMPMHKNDTPDLSLTVRILEELKNEVERRGANFLVGFIPSKLDIEKLSASLPYQIEIAQLCQQRGIECFDLAPAFKNTWSRTYYRKGMHWTARGHEVATKALYDVLTRDKNTGHP